ncbi:MAG: DNA-binding protein [Oscillospiraceae bacterium]
MLTRKFGDTIALRLLPGEDVVECVKNTASEYKIRLGVVTGIGAADCAEFGIYSVDEKKYYSNKIECEAEITSLVGNITVSENGDPYIHLHVNLGLKDGSVIGGHLNKCVICATSEIFIRVLDGEITRIKDDYTGLNVLDI